MFRKQILGAVSAALLAGVSAMSASTSMAQPVTECDRLAANPDDPDAVVPGTGFSEIDVARAVSACQDALRAHPDSLRIQYQLGRSLSRGERFGDAVRWFRTAADRGYAAAQNNLGIMYSRGSGVPKDRAEAIRWFRRAADQGNATAQNNLGLQHDYRAEVRQGADDAEAARWYRMAADQGHRAAQFNLGAIYSEGSRAVPRDRPEAVRLFRLAAGQGHVHAQFELAELLGMDSFHSKIPQDLAEAARWYRAAADQGHGKAQMTMSEWYAEGKGVKQDLVMMEMWNILASARGQNPRCSLTCRYPDGRRGDYGGRMTPGQIAEAERLAREWKPR